MADRLQGSEAPSGKLSLNMSKSEAATLARGNPDGWFIAECSERFIVGRFTSRGHRHVITYRDEPLAFDAFSLADAYLREMGVEWPLHLAD